MIRKAVYAEPLPVAAPASAVRVLIVDDDRIILNSLGEFLRLENYRTTTAASFSEALMAMERDPADIVLSDVSLPGGNGFELLHVFRRRWPDAVAIMMTGYGTIESAVEAIKMGAYDYLTKPIDDDELRVCVERATAQQRILRENRVLKEQLDLRFGLQNMVGHDYRMLKVFDLVETVAPANVTVLLQGPSGTGKSMIARVLHHLSPRGNMPFVEVSCGALPETLLESELFGHARGAFTGAVAAKTGKFKAAHGGTIFLDEISTASPGLQVKLLRVLQSREFEPVGSNKTENVDVRVILATNVDLAAEVAAGRFREDLYYRVNVVSIDMPPLQARIGDIPLLSRHFMNRGNAELKRHIRDIDAEAMRILQRYRWPGNVRELQNVVERAVLLCKGSTIGVDDLPAALISAATGATNIAGAPLDPDASGSGRVGAVGHSALLAGYGSDTAGLLSPDGRPMTLKDALAEPEKRIIAAALRANGGNRQLTADQLGINRTTLYKKMKRYGLDCA